MTLLLCYLPLHAITCLQSENAVFFLLVVGLLPFLMVFFVNSLDPSRRKSAQFFSSSGLREVPTRRFRHGSTQYGGRACLRCRSCASKMGKAPLFLKENISFWDGVIWLYVWIYIIYMMHCICEWVDFLRECKIVRGYALWQQLCGTVNCECHHECWEKTKRTLEVTTNVVMLGMVQILCTNHPSLGVRSQNWMLGTFTAKHHGMT